MAVRRLIAVAAVGISAIAAPAASAADFEPTFPPDGYTATAAPFSEKFGNRPVAGERAQITFRAQLAAAGYSGYNPRLLVSSYPTLENGLIPARNNLATYPDGAMTESAGVSPGTYEWTSYWPYHWAPGTYYWQVASPDASAPQSVANPSALRTFTVLPAPKAVAPVPVAPAASPPVRDCTTQQRGYLAAVKRVQQALRKKRTARTIGARRAAAKQLTRAVRARNAWQSRLAICRRGG